MISAVENKTFARERAVVQIDRPSSAELDGPELLRSIAEVLMREDLLPGVLGD